MNKLKILVSLLLIGSASAMCACGREAHPGLPLNEPGILDTNDCVGEISTPLGDIIVCPVPGGGFYCEEDARVSSEVIHD